MNAAEGMKAAAVILGLLSACIAILWFATRPKHRSESPHDPTQPPAKVPDQAPAPR